MDKVKKIFVLALIFAIFSFSVTGCKKKNTAADKDIPSKDTATKEAPTDDHPTGEHPK